MEQDCSDNDPGIDPAVLEAWQGQIRYFLLPERQRNDERDRVALAYP